MLVLSQARADDRSVRRAVLEAYEPFAAAIQKSYANVRATIEETQPFDQESDLVGTADVKFNLLSYVLTAEWKTVNRQTGRTSPGTKAIQGRNAKYAFSLTPKADNRLAIDKLMLHGAARQTVLCLLSVPYADATLAHETYLDMARDPDLRFVSLEDCTWHEEQMKILRVNVPVRGSMKESWFEAGYYFSPRERWICRGFWFALAGGPKQREQFYAYAASAGDDFPALRRIEIWDKSLADRGLGARPNVVEVTAFQPTSPMPDADFTLSAFGLPEPDGYTPPAAPKTWLWLIAAALGVGLLGGLFA